AARCLASGPHCRRASAPGSRRRGSMCAPPILVAPRDDPEEQVGLVLLRPQVPMSSTIASLGPRIAVSGTARSEPLVGASLGDRVPALRKAARLLNCGVICR